MRRVEERHKIHYCKEKGCNNIICYGTWKNGKGRCESCAQRGKLNSMYGTKRVFTKQTKIKMGSANRGKFGKKSSGWKGGRIKTTRGYIKIYRPNHPCHSPKGYVREHRLVMEQHLKRYLKKEEVVHHINGILDDNRIENLMLFKNQSEHIKHHGKIKNSKNN